MKISNVIALVVALFLSGCEAGEQAVLADQADGGPCTVVCQSGVLSCRENTQVMLPCESGQCADSNSCAQLLHDAGGQVCQPGQSQSCHCSADQVGTQQCNAEGTGWLGCEQCTMLTDAGLTDTGMPADTGVADTGALDAGVADTGMFDAGVPDTGVPFDSGIVDAGDAGTDGGMADTGMPADTGTPLDAGMADAAQDAGVDASVDASVDGGARDAGGSCSTDTDCNPNEVCYSDNICRPPLADCNGFSILVEEGWILEFYSQAFPSVPVRASASAGRYQHSRPHQECSVALQGWTSGTSVHCMCRTYFGDSLCSALPAGGFGCWWSKPGTPGFDGGVSPDGGDAAVLDAAVDGGLDASAGD